ncbi:MAG: AraC family ligand binding domain-containing protein, partial [Bacilli bacterium]|nr:AraC family ligand binding domain-containing protein [Bacilli bacterium]
FVKMHNKNHLIEENTIVLIPKNIAHIYGSSEQNPWEIYWIHFNGSKAKYYLPQYNTKDILIKTLTIDQLAKILPLFTSIIDTLEYNMTLNNVIHASTLLSQLL